ncbi:MAG: DEAD/DEAH box helicase [Phycisphaerales bacterium]|nr:DEAD/DEAH box helicase [Phycisphaerales bacterium]
MAQYPFGVSDQRFAALGLPDLLVRTLAACGFTQPTEVQAEAIPAALEGRDMLMLAPTGSGKTLGFALPVLATLLADRPRVQRLRTGLRRDRTDAAPRRVDPATRLRAIVLSPTRELAQQVARDIAGVIRGTVLRTTAVYGKSPIEPQRAAVMSGVDVLVGTPGRLRELLDEGAITFAHVRHVVIDEADRMVDMGFLPQVEDIMALVPERRRVICASATLPDRIAALVTGLMRDQAEVGVGKRNAPASDRHSRYVVRDADKVALLLALVKGRHKKGVAVYARTRRRVGWVAEALRRHGISVAMLHGDRSQRQRDLALKSFADGDAEVLVATDVAARGLHVPRIRTVINYDVPLMPEDFVHRVGRAGHGGGAAESHTFVGEDEREAWNRVRGLVPGEIASAVLPDLAPWGRAAARAPVDAATSAGGQPAARPASASRGRDQRRSDPQGKGPRTGKRGSGQGERSGKARRAAKRPLRGARDAGATKASTDGASFRGLARRAPIQPGTAVGRGVRTAGR